MQNLLAYYEVWLGSRKTKGQNGNSKREFRVEVAAPPENKAPPRYELVEEKQKKGQKKIYGSAWLPTIDMAKDELVKVADYCRRQAFKVMVFFEIRGPC